MWRQKYDLLTRWKVYAVYNEPACILNRTRILHRVLYMWTLPNQLHPFPVLLKERGWRDHVQVLNEPIKRCFNQSPKCVSSESSISAFELPGHQLNVCVCVIQCMVQKRSSSSMHAGNVYRLLTGIASNLIAFLRCDWSSQNYALYLMGSASFYLILENSLNWLILNYEWGWLWAFPSLAYQFFMKFIHLKIKLHV